MADFSAHELGDMVAHIQLCRMLFDTQQSQQFTHLMTWKGVCKMARVISTFFLMGCLVALFPCQSLASEKWVVMGSTVWTASGNTLTLDFPSSSPNDLRVKTSTAGDFQWIKTSPQMSLGSKIKQVIVCYKTPNAGTSIQDVRLTEYILTTASVLIDLSPIPESSEGTCYISPSLDLQPQGALNVGLRFNFANASDAVVIGALGLLIEE